MSDSSRQAAESAADRSWRMLIGGELVAARHGSTTETINPATGRSFARYPQGAEADVDDAVSAATAAAPVWADTPIRKRAAAVSALADAIEAAGEEISLLDTVDNGSPIAVMRNDYLLAVEHLRYFAGLALQLKGESIPVDDHDALDFTLRAPFGVVGRIVPFNHPFMFAASRIAAPLVAGNTVVLKPAEVTSLSALRLGELARDLLPPGVLNIVTGPGGTVGDRIVAHPDVPRIAFTGSEAVGRGIQRRAADGGVKVVTLELGGKNPIIVFDDADLDAAVEGALRGMNFTWQGQSCGSTSRLYVQETVYAEFIERLSARMASMRLGEPTDPATEIGPVVSRAQFDKVSGFIDEGRSTPGLELVTGGVAPECGDGYFIRPTLFSGRDEEPGRLYTEEIFGPVLVASSFADYDDVVARANRLPLGLTASVWTRSLRTAMSAARDIEAGYLWINWSSGHIPGAPFGGVKNSGVGREEGLGELESFTQPKNVYVRF
ncbi:aldehyde dehydrogenase family protein [Streptomyces muensis]|uniref:Aldehyde dehydrogenase family protein n=1 Tax=Streptomyces muensis TaxID=1077944 RepID=A0A9X1PS73_STRM4|nr:aldehyde dehydrogenase family protein [Streptomyces muensis]MCF1592532.1 aldehyde dehydrogenase family protein [Streptomyces muensis]